MGRLPAAVGICAEGIEVFFLEQEGEGRPDPSYTLATEVGAGPAEKIEGGEEQKPSTAPRSATLVGAQPPVRPPPKNATLATAFSQYYCPSTLSSVLGKGGQRNGGVLSAANRINSPLSASMHTFGAMQRERWRRSRATVCRDLTGRGEGQCADVAALMWRGAAQRCRRPLHSGTSVGRPRWKMAAPGK